MPPREGFFRLDQNIPPASGIGRFGLQRSGSSTLCCSNSRASTSPRGCLAGMPGLAPGTAVPKGTKRVDMGGLRMRVSKGQRDATGRVREVVLFPCLAAALLLVLAPSAFAGGVGVAATPAARAAQAPEDTSGVNEYTEQGIPGEPADNATGSPKSGQSAPGSRSKGSQGAGAADATGSQGERADDNAAAGSRPTATSGAGDQSTRASTLPRTGIDAWLLVMAGLALLGSGVLLRWAEAARPVGLFSSSRNARGVYLRPAGPQAGFRTKSR